MAIYPVRGGRVPVGVRALVGYGEVLRSDAEALSIAACMPSVQHDSSLSLLPDGPRWDPSGLSIPNTSVRPRSATLSVESTPDAVETCTCVVGKAAAPPVGGTPPPATASLVAIIVCPVPLIDALDVLAPCEVTNAAARSRRRRSSSPLSSEGSSPDEVLSPTTAFRREYEPDVSSEILRLSEKLLPSLCSPWRGIAESARS